MPIEELLKLYGAERSAQPDKANNDGNSDSTATSQPQSSKSTNNAPSASYGSLSDSDSDGGSGEDSGNEGEWRRTIQVGSRFQAEIPNGLCPYDESTITPTNDILLWKPSTLLRSNQINDYLIEYAKVTLAEEEMYSDFVLPSGAHIKDDEQALFVLFKCRYNITEALQLHEERKEPIANLSPVMTPWSEEECRSFENGLHTHGKDFFLIKHNRVPTRTVGECVQFYYLWKKTERHDIFVAKFRIEKKKYTLHPGTT